MNRRQQKAMFAKRNLTVERLRRLDDEDSVHSSNGKTKVYKIWERIERPDFNNDSERNQYLRSRGYKI